MLFPGGEASSGNKQSVKNVPGVQDAKYKSERGKNIHNVLIARTHILLKKNQWFLPVMKSVSVCGCVYERW